MRINKKICFIFVICFITLLFTNCGDYEWIISKQQILEISFAQYEMEIETAKDEGKLIKSGSQYNLIVQIGKDIQKAAEDYLKKTEGNTNKLGGFEWEFNLINDDTVNAWCMPGGKIVFYTGILPYCETDAGIAVVMGHEVSHAVLDHGRKKMSEQILWELGSEALSMLTSSEIVHLAYNVGANLGGILKGSREKETEADEYGLNLCAIAGYDPDAAAPFWERMSGGDSIGALEIFSTHPDGQKRAVNLKNKAPAAKALAKEFGVTIKPPKRIPGI